MKPWLLAVTFFLSISLASSAADADGWTPLFNGKDLTGLKVQFKDADKDADPARTFTVKDGALIVSGKPTCYIYTDKSYQNYVLTYEWRFPAGSKEDSNSGCLVHIQTPHKVMPKSVEPQGRYKDHGKLFFIGVKGEGTFDEAAHKKALKPMGEWSTTEVTCKPDGTISVKLNGVPVASGKSELTSGPIGFQSEGWEVHFRNIKIKEMK
jgi:3-keto-disaccharide hydrolase